MRGVSNKHCLLTFFHFSTAAGVPGTGVGSRWLECLTSKLHASLFSGSMLPRLHIFMSALTHSDQVFLGLPLPLVLGIVIFVMDLNSFNKYQIFSLISLMINQSVAVC